MTKIAATLLAIAACAAQPALPSQGEDLRSAPNDLVDTCDIAWNPTGAPPEFCEHACIDVPVYDGIGCSGARDGFNVKDCARTFSVDIVTGSQRGCCLMRDVSQGQVPSFYACPAK